MILGGLYKFKVNKIVYLNSIDKEMLKVDSILEQDLCIYVQPFRSDSTITPETI